MERRVSWGIEVKTACGGEVENMEEVIEKNKLHVFEERNLGVAPFVVVDVVRGDQWFVCDFCSTAIKERCYIKGVGPKIFVVGNECVAKTGDAGLINVVKREIRRLRTVDRHRKEAEVIKDAKDRLNRFSFVRETLKDKPHPDIGLAKMGRTLLDYVNWLFENAGNRGKMVAAKIVNGPSTFNQKETHASEKGKLC